MTETISSFNKLAELLGKIFLIATRVLVVYEML